MKQIIIKVLFCWILISISCKRDPLYYSMGNSAAVQFNIDWESSLLEPNGVSAYSYDKESGNIIIDGTVSSNPNRLSIAYPVGKYDCVILNDTEYELSNIYFADRDNIKTFKILTKVESTPHYSSLSRIPGVGYATETDVIARRVSSDIEITKQDIQYFLSKPDIKDFTTSKKVDISPARITELIDIEIFVKNITSAAGAPRSHLTNMSIGYWPGLNKKHQALLTLEFVLNNREMRSDNSNDGIISKQLISFGPHTTKSKFTNQHKLIMHFVLINGEDHIVELDVNNLIESSHDGVQNIHKIRSEIELPLVIGDGGGAFDPNIEDWEDVEIELPI